MSEVVLLRHVKDVTLIRLAGKLVAQYDRGLVSEGEPRDAADGLWLASARELLQEMARRAGTLRPDVSSYLLAAWPKALAPLLRAAAVLVVH